MTRIGKIARLPWGTREELNRRLRDGATGVEVVEWLNGLEEVKKMLAAEFGERPITEQNLSEWRQGGYEEWLHLQEERGWVRDLAEQTNALAKATGEVEVTHRVGTLVAVEVARTAQELLEECRGLEPQERVKRLKEVVGLIGRLRQGDQQQGWLEAQRFRDARKYKKLW